MAELKTKLTNKNPLDFIKKVKDEQKRKDSLALLKLFRDITKEKPRMWGTSIVGYGMYHYKSERSSQEGDWPLTGFSPRVLNLTLYVMPGFGHLKNLLKKLGKHKKSVGCLYIKKLSDIDLKVLKEIIDVSYKLMKKKHPSK